MKTKLLLFFLGLGLFGIMWGQEPYRNLVITEVRAIDGDQPGTYLEITNLGNEPIDLATIKFGRIGRSNAVCDIYNDPWPPVDYFFIPPSVSKVLQPGESYVICTRRDFAWNGYKARHPDFAFQDRLDNHDVYKYADFILDRLEKSDAQILLYPEIQDSVFDLRQYQVLGLLARSGDGLFLEHHFTDDLGIPDSAVIDNYKNRFNDNCTNGGTWFSVAGVADATKNARMFRKSTIKQGQLDWFSNRGIGLEDSEWIAIKEPDGMDKWREVWWTLGNHGDYTLDVNTLESDVIGVDFAGKTLTVPWGTRRLDDIMRKMDKKPGIAWIYILNDNTQDSLMRSAQTGDKLAVYVIGQTLTADTFNIVVSAPVDSDNIVIPVDRANLTGPITTRAQWGKLAWPRVTNHGAGEDTITGSGYGLAHNFRIDSLLQYLEKAPEASWEIVFVDEQKRADLKNGDKLKVTAKSGAVKEYFIEVASYLPSNNAFLSSITWPDNTLNPAQKFIYGWQGDTIPGFFRNTFNYRLGLPLNVTAIPALVAKAENVNAKIRVDRATSFDKEVADRTTTFTVISHSGRDTLVYKVEFVREVDPVNVQPFHAEPYVAEYVIRASRNTYAEIANPGNQELDLSYYMFAQGTGGQSPPEIISAYMASDSTTWASRYAKYIPGRKWVNHTSWANTPGTVETSADITVDPVVQPGDVFVMGRLFQDTHLSNLEDPSTWDIYDRVDVMFIPLEGSYGPWPNNWGEPSNEAPMPDQFNRDFYMFRILNDSVRNGMKPANDPNDFELVEALGTVDGSRWAPDGTTTVRANQMITRKPDITTPNPIIQASFGTDPESSEWIYIKNLNHFQMEAQLGQHFFNPPTYYMSTVKSALYKVSPGYSLKETIDGVKTGTTVEQFLGNIFPADPGQTHTVVALAGGSELAPDAAVSANDTLVVVSANGDNMTKYILDVSDEGLSGNATLTSTAYDVFGDEEAGTGGVANMAYGTKLSEVVSNVSKHEGAALTMVDENDLYVPLKRLNYFNQYVDVTADYNIYFEVVAENTIDKMLYQLQPEVGEDTAFITSYIYEVSQDEMIIRYVPSGTSLEIFFRSIIVSPGASVQILDKTGYERTSGSIVQDDRVVVTSSSGEVRKAYYLSLVFTDLTQTVPSLAFINSNVYVIDQIDWVIDSVVEQTTVADFLANIIPATNAQVVILDAQGNVKTSGELAQDDQVQVTSADGELSVIYTFGTFKIKTGAPLLTPDQIKLYPNPTNSKVEIDGLNPGSRIQVYNSLGVRLSDVYSQGRSDIISLDDKSAGMYFIVISNDNVPVGNYKVIKR